MFILHVVLENGGAGRPEGAVPAVEDNLPPSALQKNGIYKGGRKVGPISLQYVVSDSVVSSHSSEMVAEW